MSRRPDSPVGNRGVQCLLTSATPAPSPARTETETMTNVTEACQTLAVDLDDLRQQQSTYPCIDAVTSWIKNGRKRPSLGKLKQAPVALRKLWHEFPCLLLLNGILCRQMRSVPPSFTHHIVLSVSLIPKALSYLHGDKFSGHLGAARTMHQAQRLCYWFYMTQDITKFCAECLPCQSWDSPTPHEKAPLQSIEATRPFEKATDLTELPVDRGSGAWQVSAGCDGLFHTIC